MSWKISVGNFSPTFSKNLKRFELFRYKMRIFLGEQKLYCQETVKRYQKTYSLGQKVSNNLHHFLKNKNRLLKRFELSGYLTAVTTHICLLQDSNMFARRSLQHKVCVTLTIFGNRENFTADVLIFLSQILLRK